ncbi:MAG: YggS family pyridoxal phosphate-dependent enzyme [Clostridiales bacterium]|jgi:pyridoxal phosphate enzyme (YggS family)|nr:YggS family pyridoxal phosphate-dependent enzyme [Clostridiales bacterium]
MDSITSNVQVIKERIAEAALKSGRKPEDVLLVGVTKTIDIPRIEALIGAGVRDLGENKPQELCSKHAALGSEIGWHLIGHLQTNKVKTVIGKAKLIHSVDSLRLAEEIDKRAAALGSKAEILLEINIAGEDSKHGIAPEDAITFAQSLQHLTSIKVKGLMCIAPYVEEQENNRKYFAKLRQLFLDIGEKSFHNIEMTDLSMGMTGDYQVAVEEGATMVRVGTGIFGPRL